MKNRVQDQLQGTAPRTEDRVISDLSPGEGIFRLRRHHVNSHSEATTEPDRENRHHGRQNVFPKTLRDEKGEGSQDSPPTLLSKARLISDHSSTRSKPSSSCGS